MHQRRVRMTDQHAPQGLPEACAHPGWEKSLIEALETALDLYGELHRLAAQQARIIEEDNTEAVLDLLARREPLIAQLAEVSGTIEPFDGAWTAVLDRLDQTTRTIVQQRLETLGTISTRVADEDQRLRDRLELQRDTIRDELAELSTARSALGAYAPVAEVNPVFQDREA